MATLTIWFPSKWMHPGQMDAPNACPTLNIIRFPELPVDAFPELPVEVTLHNVKTWQLLQSGSWKNGCAHGGK